MTWSMSLYALGARESRNGRRVQSSRRVTLSNAEVCSLKSCASFKWVLLVTVALQASACSNQKDALLLIDVQLAPGLPTLTALRFSILDHSQVHTQTVAPTVTRFGYYVGGGISGTLTVLAEALDGQGCVVGRGTVTVDGVRAGETSPIVSVQVGALSVPSCAADAGTDVATGDAGPDRVAEGGGADRGGTDAGGTGAGGTDAGADHPDANRLLDFGPQPTFANLGQVSSPTFPMPLAVHLTGALPVDTFVAVSSGDTAALVVVGGGVTIRAGQTSTAVLVHALAATPAVTLTARLGTEALTAQVRVLGVGEQAALSDLSPASAEVTARGTLTLTLTLDIPAAGGGMWVELAVQPPGAAVLPASVMVPVDQLSATFDYVDAGIAVHATVTATLGASTRTATVTVPGPRPIINEVDYDNPDLDTAEFIEIYNAGTTAQDLTNLQLVLVNGSSNLTYSVISLAPAGVLPAGAYVVVGPASLLATVPGVLGVDPGVETNILQNGDPDGLALVDSANHIVLDALSYDGAIMAAQVTYVGVVSLVEGTVAPLTSGDSTLIQGSMCRLPDGVDTNDASIDWHFCNTPTPGAPNTP